MKGILFKPDMFQAIIEKRKTVTRRTAGLEQLNEKPADVAYLGCNNYQEYMFEIFFPDGTSTIKEVKPRYLPGETVYMKESYCSNCCVDENDTEVCYRKDDNGTCVKSRWQSPLFLPEKYARYFIRIISVRPERLQDITIQDVIAEGISPCSDSVNSVETMLSHYATRWNSINGKKVGYSWYDNPWVWRYEFELIERQG